MIMEPITVVGCPLCKEHILSNEKEDHFWLSHSGLLRVAVSCGKCGRSGPTAPTSESAIMEAKGVEWVYTGTDDIVWGDMFLCPRCQVVER